MASNVQKSSYQLNVSQPVKEEKPTSTTRGELAKIYKLSQLAPEAGRNLANLFSEAQLDKTSQYYDPYVQPTNKAVAALQSYGFDINNLNDDWFSKNNGWISSNLVYNGQTNTPSAPTKKSTMDQQIAYQLYQYQKSEADTKKAEQQWQVTVWDRKWWKF